MRRGQTSLEFLVLLGFMVIVFSSVFILMTEKLAAANENQVRQGLMGIGEQIQDEIVMADQVNPGYSRIFELPPVVRDRPYSARIIMQRELVLNTSDQEVLIFLDVDSNVSGGENGTLGIRNLIENLGGINIVPFDDEGQLEQCPYACSGGDTCERACESHPYCDKDPDCKFCDENGCDQPNIYCDSGGIGQLCREKQCENVCASATMCDNFDTCKNAGCAVETCSTCGDTQVTGLEACDTEPAPGNFGGKTCLSQTGGTKPDGDLACIDNCLTIDTGSCYNCGDGTPEPPMEACDCGGGTCGDCTDLPYTYIYGTYSCKPDCSDYSYAGCYECSDCTIPNCNMVPGLQQACVARCGSCTGGDVCGDGQITGSEVCDPGDGMFIPPNFGGKTCETETGILGGTLTCLACTNISTQSCDGCKDCQGSNCLSPPFVDECLKKNCECPVT